MKRLGKLCWKDHVKTGYSAEENEDNSEALVHCSQQAHFSCTVDIIFQRKKTSYKNKTYLTDSGKSSGLTTAQLVKDNSSVGHFPAFIL